jgi:hypothetical protein
MVWLEVVAADFDVVADFEAETESAQPDSDVESESVNMDLEEYGIGFQPAVSEDGSAATASEDEVLSDSDSWKFVWTE